MKKDLKIPIYDAKVDGNVFDWILEAAEDFRKIRQREHYVQYEKALLKPENLSRAKVENIGK